MTNLNNTLLLIWKNPSTRQNHVVGQLEKGVKYTFKYSDDVENAIKEGFKKLIGFEDLNKEYVSDILFPVFSSRLPDKKRRDISNILDKYHIKQYDEYLLLKNGGSKLPIDTIEFAPALGQAPFDITFYVAGTRHYIGCNVENSIDGDSSCSNAALYLKPNDTVFLAPEPNNSWDKNAIRLITKNNELIGYIPRYYCQNILSILEENKFQLSCCIEEFNAQKPCENCIKVRLTAE
ncbi:HIRAN domain-containing protein [Oscillibacter sp.]|uniref:HIRAN domain-containing protein n=1 Tax=Oscillibacter sp. TaxID=1945593 RepID=UPI002899685A|nr:HIRAN domain-containing protein [Oscillibacter sp.]